MRETVNLLLAGVGGQGIILAGDLVADRLRETELVLLQQFLGNL